MTMKDNNIENNITIECIFTIVNTSKKCSSSLLLPQRLSHRRDDPIPACQFSKRGFNPRASGVSRLLGYVSIRRGAISALFIAIAIAIAVATACKCDVIVRGNMMDKRIVVREGVIQRVAHVFVLVLSQVLAKAVSVHFRVSIIVIICRVLSSV
jgi:hypothetical protein